MTTPAPITDELLAELQRTAAEAIAVLHACRIREQQLTTALEHANGCWIAAGKRATTAEAALGKCKAEVARQHEARLVAEASLAQSREHEDVLAQEIEALRGDLNAALASLAKLADALESIDGEALVLASEITADLPKEMLALRIAGIRFEIRQALALLARQP